MPQVQVLNQLNQSISIFDSFSNDADSSKTEDTSYYGTLSLLGTVPADGTATLTLQHDFANVLIAFDGNQAPLTRYQWTALDSDTPPPFTVSQTDVATIQLSESFVIELANNPNGELASGFQTAFGQGPDAVDSFFKSNPSYSQCTFVSYMLALVYEAQTQTNENKVYSLAKLVRLGGLPYPPEMPDIEVSNFSCQYANQVLDISGQIDLTELPYESDAIMNNILSLFPIKTVDVDIQFVTQPGLNLFNTQLSFIANNFNIPVGDGKTITIQSPSVSLSITPLFKFVVFTARAYIPFSLFGYQFKANISMTIDNIEAEIGAVIDVNNASLPSPSIMQGIHFDEFGVGMGIMFEPPGYALGVQGKFHIGSGSGVVELDDDTFVIVCELEDDIPNPLYLSYYVPKLDINTLIDLYTNANVDIDLPIEFKDLSFVWCEDLMNAVVLPDGTLSNGEYGFSAFMDMLGLEFYSNVQISLNGIEGTAQLSPIDLFGGLLKIEGHSKDVVVKVDANGTIIKNNQIPTTQAAKQAIANAKSVTLIKGGGAEMRVSTSSQPYLSISSQMSLLDAIKQDISTTVDNSGIQFELDFGCIIQTKMICVLKDYHKFTGSFSYGPDFYVPLSLVGISLGTIHIDITISATLGLSVNESDINFSVGGGFDLEGLTLNFGPYGLDINISGLSDVLSNIEQYIIQEAETIFKDILADAKKWAEWVKNGIVSISEDVMNGLKNAYKLAYKDAALVLHDAGYAADEVGRGLSDVYGLAYQGVAQALHDVGYVVDDVAIVLSNVYWFGSQEAVCVLREAGYALDDVAHALSDVYELAYQDVAQVLHDVGYAADEVANWLSRAYGMVYQDAAQVLHDVGYAVDDIAHALSDAYELGYEDVAQGLRDVGYAAGEVARGLYEVYGLTCRDVAQALHDVGYAVDDVAHALSDVGYASEEVAKGLIEVYQLGYQEAAQALHDVGYAADDVAHALRDVYELGYQDVAQALYQVGYAADDVAHALRDVYFMACQYVAQVLYDVGYAVDDVAHALSKVYGMAYKEAAYMLSDVGYAVDDIAHALSDVFEVGYQDVVQVLHDAGYAVDDVVNAIANVFTGVIVRDLNTALQQAGYAVNDIKNAFVSFGGDLAHFAEDAWHTISHDLNPSNW